MPRALVAFDLTMLLYIFLGLLVGMLAVGASVPAARVPGE